MRTERVNELKASMKSFGKEKYQKAELLDEMFALQQEIVSLTFNQDHAALAELRIWDVEKHLEQMNEELGNVADEELQRFIEGSKILCNLIKAEISGNRGEAKAFRTLEYIKSRNYVLKNVELSDGDFRTELDAVVITPSAITIVEVKNTAKDIFIDEAGNYFRTGEFLRLDCNIGEKMQIKEELLRKALSTTGYGDVEINSVVVFTNNRIEVQNKFEGLRTCFSSQLSYKVEGNRSRVIFSDEDMDAIKACIEEAENKEAYLFEFDVEQYKTDYATLMAKLEEASIKSIEVEDVAEESIKATPVKKGGFDDVIRNIFTSKYARYAGGAAAAFAVSFIISAVTATTIHKGGF